MERYNTVFEEKSEQIVEKRSRFIAHIAHIETVEEATEFISRKKSEFWDAKHNVSAFWVNEGNITRSSDDGEPHSTAGKPVLETIVGNDLRDVCIVVTRYFGGVLLGTGGLVRAYQSAAAKVIEASEIFTMSACQTADVICDYSQYDMLRSFFESESIKISNTVFDSRITVSFGVGLEKFQSFKNNLIEKFNGKISVFEKEIKIFPQKIKENGVF